MPETIWIVHISDLHFKSYASGGGWIPKATGHDPRALKALSKFLRQFDSDHRDQNEVKVLVVSGDVTARGAPDEFVFYRTVVDSVVPLTPPKSAPPLSQGFHHVVELPGNHDYWNGWPLNPFLTPVWSLFHAHRNSARIDFGHQQQLALNTICSTSGANPIQQMAAVGAFVPGEVTTLKAKMNAPSSANRTYHLVVTHHSPAHGFSYFHGVTAAARADLAHIRSSVPHVLGLLCGHAHSTEVTHDAKLPTEARSGTALQSAVPRRMAKNTFLVHKLTNDGQTVDWSATRYRLEGARFRAKALYAIT